MALYIRVQTSFFTHRKTAKLRAKIGDDALWLIPRLWAYAAEHQPDGDFSAYEACELAMLLGYNKDASSMLEAMQQAGFLDEMQVHDWPEYNGYHDAFAERAKKAAEKRWEKHNDKKEKRQEKRREEKKGKETSNAPSIDKQCLEHACSIEPWRDEVRMRIRSWFNQRETTVWDKKEMAALMQIRETLPDELDALEARYTSTDKDTVKYRRQAIDTLLNNWNSEIIRATADHNKKGKDDGRIF